MESDIHPSLFFSYYLRPLPIHTNPPLPTLTYPYQSLPTLMSSLSPLLTPPTPHSSLPACLLDLTSLIKLHSFPLASIMFCDVYSLDLASIWKSRRFWNISFAWWVLYIYIYSCANSFQGLDATHLIPCLHFSAAVSISFICQANSAVLLLGSVDFSNSSTAFFI